MIVPRRTSLRKASSNVATPDEKEDSTEIHVLKGFLTLGSAVCTRTLRLAEEVVLAKDSDQAAFWGSVD